MDILRYSSIGDITWRSDEFKMTFRAHGPCAIDIDGDVYFSQLSSRTYNRKSGPAIIRANGAVTYRNARGAYHRTDGPAVIGSDGNNEYWINNVHLSPEEFFIKCRVL